MKTFKITLIALAVLFGCNNLFAQETISPDRKKAIDSLALEKVRDLSKYIALVGSKETPWSEAQRVIQRAEELFMPGSEMGVSSIYRPEITYFKVREYFDRLMRLNYQKVNIDWYNIEYVSDLEQQPDGTFVGVITIFQRFEGFDKEKGLVYRDTTKKDITIYVKRKETQIGGRTIGFWDVLLGDIRVKETRP
jgi:hypothetical protein